MSNDNFTQQGLTEIQKITQQNGSKLNDALSELAAQSDNSFRNDLAPNQQAVFNTIPGVDQAATKIAQKNAKAKDAYQTKRYQQDPYSSVETALGASQIVDKATAFQEAELAINRAILDAGDRVADINYKNAMDTLNVQRMDLENALTAKPLGINADKYKGMITNYEGAMSGRIKEAQNANEIQARLNLLAGQADATNARYGEQKMFNALKRFKQEVAEDNFMQAKQDASEALYNSLLQKTSDEQYKSLIDSNVVADYNNKPIETDLIPSVVNTFMDTTGGVVAGLGSLYNTAVLSEDEKKAREEAFKRLRPDLINTTLGDRAIQVGDAIRNSPVDYQNKYNIDSLELDMQANKNLLDKALTLAKGASATTLDTVVGSLPEIIATSAGAGVAGRFIKGAADVANLARGIRAGEAVATTAAKEIAGASALTQGATADFTKQTIKNTIGEVPYNKFVKPTIAKATTSAEVKTLLAQKTTPKEALKGLAKDSWYGAKPALGLLSMASAGAGVAYKNELEGLKKQGVDTDKLGYLVSLKKEDILPAMAYTALNLVEFGVLVKPFLGSARTKLVGEAVMKGELSKAGKLIAESNADRTIKATLAIAAAKLGGTAISEGATEAVQTVMEDLIKNKRINDGTFVNSILQVLADPSSYKEIKDSAITGALAGGTTSVAHSIPSTAKSAVMGAINKGSEVASNIMAKRTSEKMQAQDDINTLSKANADIEKGKELSLKDVYKIAASPKTRKAFLEEADTTNNKEYRSLVKDIASVNADTDIKAKAEELATKYPKYSEQELSDIVAIAKHGQTKYSDIDKSNLSRDMIDTIEGLSKDTYDNSPNKQQLANKSFEDLNLQERYILAPKKPSKQQSEEAKPVVEVTEDNRLVTSLEGVGKDKSKADTYVNPIDITTGDLKAVDEKVINDFNTVFSRDRLEKSEGEARKRNVRKALHAFETTLAVAEANGDTTHSTALKDTDIGSILNSIRQDVLLAGNPLQAYKELDENSIEKEVMDSLLDELRSMPTSRKITSEDGKVVEEEVDVNNPIVDMLTSSDIVNPKEEPLKTKKVDVLGTQGSNSTDTNKPTALEALTEILNNNLQQDAKTRRLRNVNKMTAKGVIATKAAEAIRKIKYVQALRSAFKDSAGNQNMRIDILGRRSIESIKELEIIQNQAKTRINALSLFFEKVEDSKSKGENPLINGLKALGVNTTAEEIPNYIRELSGAGDTNIVLHINQNNGHIRPILKDDALPELSKFNEQHGRNQYLMYIPVKTMGNSSVLTIADSGVAISDGSKQSSLLNDLKEEVAFLDNAIAYLKTSLEDSTEGKQYIEQNTLKVQDDITEKLVKVIDGMKDLTDYSVRETIKDTLGKLTKLDSYVKKINFYINKVQTDSSYDGNINDHIDTDTHSVTLHTSTLSLIKAADLRDALIAERDNLLFNMKIFFNGQKDASDILALVALWNSKEVNEGLLNNFMSPTLAKKARALISRIAEFFGIANKAITKFNHILRQVNATRPESQKITVKDIEFLSKTIMNKSEADKLSNEDRYDLITTTYQILGVLTPQTDKKYGFGDPDNLLSELLPDASTLVVNKDTIDLSSNLIGGYYLPDAKRIPSYSMFNTKGFNMNNYSIDEALTFSKFYEAMRNAITKDTDNVNHNNLFLDLFEMSPNTTKPNNLDRARDKITNVKEAVARSWYMSIVGLLSNEKLIGPMDNISSNKKDTEANQKMSSTYQAEVIVNDMLRNFGLNERSTLRSAGDIADAKEQLKNMVQKIMKITFTELGEKDEELDKSRPVVIDKDTNIIKLADKKILPAIQEKAKAFADRGYISPKEVAAKEHISDVLKDIELTQKGNIFSAETDSDVVKGILAQTLMPLEYNTKKMSSFVTHLSKGGNVLANEVKSLLPSAIQDDPYFKKTGKIKLSQNLFDSQVSPIVYQVAKELGKSDADANAYVKAFQNEVVTIENTLNDAPIVISMLAGNTIPILDNKIQQLLEVIQESKTNRGSGTPFYYNTKAGPNDRTTIEGLAHQQSNKFIRHFIKKVLDDDKAKKLYDKQFSKYVYKGNDVTEAKKAAKENLLMAIGTNLDIVDLTKVSNGEYRQKITKINEEFLDKLKGVSSEAEKAKLMQENMAKVEEIVKQDKAEYKKLYDEAVSENGEAYKTAREILRETKDLDTLDKKISKLRSMEQFKAIPSYRLIDVLEAVEGLNAIENSNTLTEVRSALYDALNGLETLETDGQTFGPVSINSLNYVERAARKLSLAGNISLSNDPLMYMDDDNYNFTAQVLFSEWFATILNDKLSEVIDRQNLTNAYEGADPTNRILIAKKALIKELIGNAREFVDDNSLRSYESLLDIVLSKALFNLKDPIEIDTMTKQSMQDILDSKISAIRKLSKPILQLSGYGSGIKNNTKGFIDSFYMDSFPIMYARILPLVNTTVDKKNTVDIVDPETGEIRNSKLREALSPTDVAVLKLLGVRNLKDLHELVKDKGNGELDYDTLDKASSNATTALIGVVTQALQRVSPFQAQRTALVMGMLEQHVKKLAVEINKKLGKGNVTYVAGNSEKAGSIDYTDVNENDFISALDKIADSKDPKISSLVGILMGDNGSITNFVRRSTEASTEQQGTYTPLGTTAKKTRVYFSPVNLSLVTNFGQSMDAKVDGKVQDKLAADGIFVGLDNYDAFTTAAPFIQYTSELANEAMAELVNDDKANLAKTMLKQGVKNLEAWYNENGSDKEAIAKLLGQVESYLQGLQVAKDLRTVHGVQVDNFGGNYRLNSAGDVITAYKIDPADPDSKEYKEAFERLYPLDGASSQKATQFYTELVPTIEWLNAYSDLWDKPLVVISKIKELVNKQANLDVEYSNKDTIEASKKAVEAIKEFLQEYGSKSNVKATDFYAYMAKKLDYSDFRAFSKLQDTFFTQNLTKSITEAPEIFRKNPVLKSVEYGRNFANKQNIYYKNDMQNVDSVEAHPTDKSNFYVTNINKAREGRLTDWTLEYNEGSGYTFNNIPYQDAIDSILDGQVYNMTKAAYDHLKEERRDSGIKQTLENMRTNRGIEANNIVVDTEKYVTDIKPKLTGANPGTELSNLLQKDLREKLSKGDFKDIYRAVYLGDYLKNIKPDAFDTKSAKYGTYVTEAIEALESEIRKPNNNYFLIDPKTGLSVIDQANRESFAALKTYLDQEIIPFTKYKGFEILTESSNEPLSFVDYTEDIPDYVLNAETEDTDTNNSETSDDTRGTQGNSNVEDLEKDLYKEITLENGFTDLVDTFNELSDLSGLDQEHKNMYTDLLSRFFTKTNGNRFFRDGLEIKIYKTDEKTEGKFLPSTNKIEIYLGTPSKSYVSPAEAYMHELIHAVTEYAIQSSDPEAQSIVRNAEDIRRELMKYYNSDKAKLDLANRLGFIGTDSKKIQDITSIYLDYMNGSISEFIAIAMTNKAFQDDISKLKNREAKGFIERLVRFFSRLLNALTNTPQEIDLEHNSGSQAVYQLALRLANNNNNLQSVYKQLKYRSTLQKWLDAVDKITNKTVSRWIDNETIKLATGVPARNIYSLVKYLFFATRNPVIASKAMKLLVNDFNFAPNGFMATTLSNISTLDDSKRMVNTLLAQSANLDKERLLLHTSLQKELKAKFGRELTKEESRELGKIIQVYDLRAISDNVHDLYLTYFSNKTNNETKSRIREEITDTLNSIKGSMKDYVTPGNSNRIDSLFSYYNQKTRELADYISKGKISSNMLLNAYNIAQAITDTNVVDNRSKHNKNEIIAQERVNELASKLDKLISLRALENASDTTLSNFRDLYEGDLTKDGVVNAFDMHKISKNGLENELMTKGVISNEVKGYVRTRTNESVDIIVAPIAEEADLKADGYRLVKDYSNIFKFGGKGLGMYISTTNMQPKFNRGVLRTTSNSSRGMTIQSAVNNMFPLETTDKKQAIVAQLIAKLKKDNRNQSEEFVPVFDARGQIVDYRLLLSQRQKEQLEIANTDLFDTLPNAITRYMDKVQSEAHNKKVLEELEKYYHKNKGNEEFIYIGPEGVKAHNPKIKKESDLAKIQEIWDLIPGTTKDYIQDNLQGMDKGIYIQASQFASIAGNRDFRLTDTDAFKRIVPIAYFRRLAKMLEYGIIKMGQWRTQKIVITNPDVIIGNLASNQYVLTSFGLDPISSMKYYAEAISYIKAYNFLKEKEVNLKKDMELSTDERAKARYKADLVKIQNKMKDNPIYQFDTRGLISDIAEDMPKTEEQQDFIDRAIENSLNKVGVPQAFREAFDVVMVNEGTTLHSAYATLVKYSDLVARYALYKHLTLTDNLEDTQMFDLLDRAFINYTPAQHPILKYANDIGFARFTKYWLRVQSHISQDLLGSKLGSTMAIHAVAKMMGIPLSTPLNAIFFRKFMNYDTTFGIPAITDIDNIYDDLADGLIITNPLVSLKKLF